MAARAVNYDIVIEQGARFTLTITWYDSLGNAKDLTHYSAKMQIRNYIGDSNIIDTLESGDEITLDSSGHISIDIPASATSGYNFNRARYDLELWPNADSNAVVRLVQGNVRLDKEVTL